MVLTLPFSRCGPPVDTLFPYDPTRGIQIPKVPPPKHSKDHRLWTSFTPFLLSLSLQLVSLQLVSPARLSSHTLPLCPSVTAMVITNSKTRRTPANRDTIQLPTASAFNICDGLFKMANCLVVELPEAQLRDIRYALETLVSKVDRLLESGEYDLSLNFDGLTVDPSECLESHPDISALISAFTDIPGAEDFGTPPTPSSTASDFGTSSSSSTNTNSSGLSSLTPSPRRPRQNTIRVAAPTIPAPTPAPSPTPTLAPVPYHGQFPFIISSRENVGLPDYTHHPLFVRPGRSYTSPGHANADYRS